ncbi:hypothetical protein [Roseibium sp. M-1]
MDHVGIDAVARQTAFGGDWVEAFANYYLGAARLNRAWAFLSILIGALTTARAMSDETLAENLTAAAMPAAIKAARGT